MKRLLYIITLMLALVFALASCGDDEPSISVNDDGYVVVNGVATKIIADKDDVITVDEEGYVVVNGVKTEYKIHTTDEISVNADGYVVVNGVTTEIVADKDDVITVDDDGFVVVNGVTTEIVADKDDVVTVKDGYLLVNGVKTEHKIYVEPVNENPQGLLFVLNDDNTYTVEIGQAKYEEKIEIPATYNGKAVTKVGEFGYETNTSLKEIIIPEGIKIIGMNAFHNCINLTNVDIPDSVSVIENYAFDNCSNLVSVTLGKNVKKVDHFAFNECDKLIEVINQSSLKIVNKSYTSNDYDIMLSADDIHSGESKIGVVNDYVFYSNGGNNYLVSYVGCESSITLPSNYNREKYIIARYAFESNSTIVSVIISDGVTKIENRAFAYCENLIFVTIGNSVEELEKDVFYRCKRTLLSVKLGDGITILDENAFNECTILELINYSSLDIIVGNSGYYGRIIEVHNGDSKISFENDFIVYRSSELNYILGYIGQRSDIVIPNFNDNKNYEIYGGAFAYRSDITSITIGNSVTKIRSSAFKDCKNLKEVIVDSSVVSIGGDVFSGCEALEYIYFNANLLDNLSNCNGIFAYCGQESKGIKITVGKDVLKIPSYLFSPHPHYTYMFPKISSIEFEQGSICESIDAYAFYNCDITDIYYPGTELEWAEISIDSCNDSLATATIHYNYIPEE